MYFKIQNELQPFLAETPIFYFSPMVGRLGYVKILSKDQLKELYEKLGGVFKHKFSIPFLRKSVIKIIKKEKLSLEDLKAVSNLKLEEKIKRCVVKTERLEDFLFSRYGVLPKYFSGTITLKKRKPRKPKVDNTKPIFNSNGTLINSAFLDQKYECYKTIPKLHNLCVKTNMIHYCSNTFCINQASFLCSECKNNVYCSAVCQRNHWVSVHNKECSMLKETWEKIKDVSKKKRKFLSPLERKNEVEQYIQICSQNKTNPIDNNNGKKTSVDKLSKLFKKLWDEWELEKLENEPNEPKKSKLESELQKSY